MIRKGTGDRPFLPTTGDVLLLLYFLCNLHLFLLLGRGGGKGARLATDIKAYGTSGTLGHGEEEVIGDGDGTVRPGVGDDISALQPSLGGL